MRPSLARLVEAARALRLTRHDGGHGVRIGSPPAELPPRLLALLSALEAVDAESGAASFLDADPQKLSDGIDGVFRWIAAQGLSTEEPLAILSRAMGRPAKRPAKLVPMPSFAPGFRKKKSWKPKISIVPDIDQGMPSLCADATNKLAFDVRETARLMGHAAVRQEERADGEVPLTMGPC